MLYRTENIEVDTLNFHLSLDGNAVAVEPQVFDLIAYLITHRDRLVTRQELFDKLWSERIVSDTSLSNHIKSARKALGDDGQKQQIIKTVHGRGYQFIADTEEIDEKTATSDSSKIEISNDDKSIAVLAFADLSPEQDQEYFSDGITDELIILLAKIPELRVISRTSSFSFKGKNATTKGIGKQLNVTHILEGSVRKAGSQLRINTQLIQVSDESNLWSETYNREMENIFEVQDDIAQAIIKQLKITLLEDMAKTTIVNPDAYMLYLEAKHLAQQFTRESNSKAEKIINESIAIDPHYAPSWEFLGKIITNSTLNYFLKPYKEGMKKSGRAAQKAIELDPEYAPAYALLAQVNIANWEFETADYNINKALLLDNGNASVLNSASIVFGNLGRMDKAIALLHQAIKLDPLQYSYYLNLGIHQLMFNQLDKAEDAVKKYAFYRPDAELMHNIMAWILIAQNKFEEALQEAEKEPHEFWRVFPKACILFALGNNKQADDLLAQLLEQYGDSQPSYISYVYAFRKENDKAFKWLEIAFERQDPNLIEEINFIGVYRELNDPRLDIFLTKMGLPKDHWLFTAATHE